MVVSVPVLSVPFTVLAAGMPEPEASASDPLVSAGVSSLMISPEEPPPVILILPDRYVVVMTPRRSTDSSTENVWKYRSYPENTPRPPISRQSSMTIWITRPSAIVIRWVRGGFLLRLMYCGAKKTTKPTGSTKSSTSGISEDKITRKILSRKSSACPATPSTPNRA